MKDVQEVSEYDISYYSGSEQHRARYRAMIGLRGADSMLIGVAYFHPDDSDYESLPHCSADGQVIPHYPMSSYAHVVDILRNESPVFLRFIDSVPPVASIDTSTEPVGEGEHG